MSTVYINDEGTEILLNTGTDLSGATAVAIEAHRPDGSIVEWPADVVGTKLRYIAPPGTFSLSGTYRLQTRATLPNGRWRGDTFRLVVRPRFA